MAAQIAHELRPASVDLDEMTSYQLDRKPGAMPVPLSTFTKKAQDDLKQIQGASRFRELKQSMQNRFQNIRVAKQLGGAVSCRRYDLDVDRSEVTEDFSISLG